MKIAILSRNQSLYSTRRLYEETINKGHDPQIFDHLKLYVSIRQGKPSIHYGGQDIGHFDAVIPRIGASVTFYGTAMVRQFEMMGVFSAVESQAITRSRDKLRSLQIMARAGLGLPVTGFARNAHDVDDCIEMVGGTPLVIKLLEGTQGVGVVLAETKKAAKSVVEAFYGLDINILIQEFIKESKGTDIRAFVVDGRIVGAMMRHAKEGEFRANLHMGGKAELVKLTRDERYAALKAASVLGLKVAGVDMLRSKRGPLIIEVNSSPGLEGIENATGLNIAGSIIDFVIRGAKSNQGPRSKNRDRIGV